jgi:DNA-directed RNA polymerase subunit K/omega
MSDEEDIDVGEVDEVESIDSSDESDDESLEEIEDDDAPVKTKVDPILKFSNEIRTIIVVADEDRITSSRVTKSEAANLIATRAQQIAANATNYAEKNISHDPVKIAYNELKCRRCPLKIRRSLGVNAEGVQYVEDWDPNSMAHPQIDL